MGDYPKPTKNEFFNGLVSFENLSFGVSQDRFRSQKILLLLSREFVEESYFFRDYLPLDLFKVLLKESYFF